MRFVSSQCSAYFRYGFAVLIALCSVRLVAHPAYLTAAVATIQRDGDFKMTLTFDALAFALNDSVERIPDDAMNALLDGPRSELDQRLQQARVRFLRHFEVLADGHPVAVEQLLFPLADDVLRWNAAAKMPRLPVLLTCEAQGRLPVATQSLVFRFPEIIGSVVLGVERPGVEPFTEAVNAGEASSSLSVRIDAPLDGIGGTATVSTVATTTRVGYFQTVVQFMRLGFEHILPRGFDHVLFVLGLFLLAGRLPSLLWQVTAFTVAHSVTLGLSLYGVIRMPSVVIEPLIALSIVLVTVDNIRGGELRWWRVAVVFGFGLIHGMGFAGALRDLGLPRSEFVRALLGFNLGVEAGQLAVIALAFTAVGWFRLRPSYRRRVVVPCSTCIGCVALTWTIQRIAVLCG